MTPDVLASNDTTVALPVIGQRNDLTAHRSSLPALTGIRFVAAMAVIFYHSKMPEVLSREGLIAASNLIANGRFAVPLFFILSGFILSYTYEGQIRIRSGARRFWEARFARIWPLYAFSLLCSTIANHRTPSLLRAVATIFMVQSWNPVDKGVAASWNFVCWTLSTEALFYLIFPFLQSRLERRSALMQLALLAVSLAISVWFSTAGISYANADAFTNIPLAAIHVPDFLVGVCAGNVYLRRSSLASRGAAGRPMLPGRGLWTCLAIVFSIFLLCHLEQAYTSWITAGFAAMIFGLAAEKSAVQKLLSTRALLVGGQISYGIYLLQWPCKAEVNRACDYLQIQSMNVRFGIDCVVLIIFAAICFYCIEEPARKIIRSGFSKLQPR